MTVEITTKGSASAYAANEAVFGQDYNEDLVHQLVTSYLAGARQGTKAQKNRAAVAGGGSKPWRQKGSGRARAGTISSPLFRSGGVTFAAQPRNFAQKLNKKMYRAGLRSILSELVRQERLFVDDGFMPESPKTRELAEKLTAYGDSRLLLLVTDVTDALALSARNNPRVHVASIANVSPVDLVGATAVIATSDAIKALEEKLS